MTGWKVRREGIDSIQCSLVKNPVVYLEPIPRQKIGLLMGQYPHQEWLGYLVGRTSKEKNYFIEDLSIPPHKEVSAASAEAEPFHIPARCVGVIHSHNGMGAFHSGTDQDYVDKNFPVSVTVSKRNGNLEFDTVSYQLTPCGKGITVKGCVKYVQPEPPAIPKAFLKKAIENIDKGRKVYQPTYPIGNGFNYFNRAQLPYSGFMDYTVDERGRVVTQKELDAHLKEIYDD